MLVLAALVAIFALTALAAEDAKYEPAFPQIFDAVQGGRHRLHLLSESVHEQVGVQTTREYVDLEVGKYTMIADNPNGHLVTHSDAKLDRIFLYKPYTCQAMVPRDLEGENVNGLWAYHIGLKNLVKDSTHALDVYGLVALWMNVGKMAKSYSKAGMIYSTSSNLYQEGHRWTVEHKESKSLVHMYFVSGLVKSKEQRLSLEMIQVESLESKKVVRAINVLSFDID